MKEINVMEIGGFRVGQVQDEEGMTGCTVLLFDEQAPAGVDVRGGGPASRETPLLNPVADAKGIHAILLSGGSAFGLDAAGGVMKYLEERNIGFDACRPEGLKSRTLLMPMLTGNLGRSSECPYHKGCCRFFRFADIHL